MPNGDPSWEGCAIIRLTRILLRLLLVAVTASGCGTNGGDPFAPSPLLQGPEGARAYLDGVLKTMETYAIHKHTIDWADFRAQVVAAAGNPRAISDLYPAIELALRLLDDHESYYMRRDGLVIGTYPFGACAAPPVDTPTSPRNIGYVSIQGSRFGQSPDSIQQAIRTADHGGLLGWIVDLRGNGGGNMWPMIAGVGPVLGEGIIGWIIYNNREYEREYRDGAAQSLGEAFSRVSDPYTLMQPYPKVAVLTDGLVNSAGEAMAVWFRGRPRTRSFGTPTCGHHHLQQDFPLTDGATLFLTTAQNADRLRTTYGGPIPPDEIIADPQGVMARAVAWIEGP